MASNNRLSQFQCSWPGCTLSYQRREHLNRHLKQHLEPKEFPCPHCAIVVGRSDTLRRHVSRRHEGKESIRSRALRACAHCKTRKTQCSMAIPCSSCLERGWLCSYEDTSACTTGGSQHQKQTLATPGQARVVSLDQEITELDKYTNNYFTHFHPTWSFLHKSSFRPEKESQVLVHSVVMAGLWSSNGKGAKEAAIEMHQTLIASIRLQRVTWDVSQSQTIEDASAWPLATYQAILLNVILPLTADNQDSSVVHPGPELPAPDHEILVALVKSSLKRGMFSYPRMLIQYQQTALTPHTAPHIWIGIEEAKRFALTLYHVWKMYCETQVSSEDGCTDLLSLHDLQFSAPISDDLWNADSVPELIRMVEEEKANGNQICDNEMNWVCNWSHDS